MISSHLEQISDEGIQLMAEHKSVAVLLPTTAYFSYELFILVGLCILLLHLLER